MKEILGPTGIVLERFNSRPSDSHPLFTKPLQLSVSSKCNTSVSISLGFEESCLSSSWVVMSLLGLVHLVCSSINQFPDHFQAFLPFKDHDHLNSLVMSIILFSKLMMFSI